MSGDAFASEGGRFDTELHSPSVEMRIREVQIQNEVKYENNANKQINNYRLCHRMKETNHLHKRGRRT